MGMRQLIGTLSGAGSKPHRTSSNFRRSSSVSPIPMIPPQQTAMPRGLHGANRVQAVFEGVGGNDPGIELRAGIEVVIVGGDAGRGAVAALPPG